MKTNLFEKITRFFAPPTRILAMLLTMIGVSNVWAIVPTVTWETGEFGKTKIGVDGNSYSITLNTGNTINGDGNILIGGNIGATIDVSGASGSKVSVLIEYEGLSQESSDKYAIAGMKDSSGHTAGLRADNGKLKGFYDSTTKTLGTSDIVATSDSGTILMSYGATEYLYGYTGANRSNLSGGIASGVRWSNNTVSLVAVGGAAYSTTDYPGWKNLVIKKVALFVGMHIPATNSSGIPVSKLQYYKFPSELVAETNDDYAKWAYAERVITWTSTSQTDIGGASTFSLFDRKTGTDASPAVTYTGNQSFDCYQFFSKMCYVWMISSTYFSDYLVPGPVLRLAADQSSTATKTIGGSFGPLTLGGMIVESGAGEYTFSQNTADGTTRSTILGDPTGETETWFDIDENLTFARGGLFCISGTINLDIAASKTLTLQSGVLEANYPKCFAQVGQNCATTVPGGHLKMHGGGQIAATKLTAVGTCLDFSDLDANRASSVISGELAVNDLTTYVFPTGVGATFPVATSVTGISATEQTFTINGNDYKAPLAFTSGNAVFPAVATLDSDKAWSAISWDAKPTTIDNTTVATLNITGNTTLDIDAATSLDKLVLNISDGITLNLTTPGNLTLTSGLVLRGTGTLKINGVVTTPAFDVEDSATILFSGDSAAITVTVTATVASGKTLYIGAENWTTPALGGTRNVISATTLTNNGTVSIGAVTGDEGRTYTVSVSGNNVSVMRMTSEAFAYDTYPGGGDATGWATSWGEEFDANQLRVGPSETYKYAYYTTGDVHPYQGSLTDRGDSLSLSVYADLSQTPSSGKAVIVGFGGAGTANNKLLMLYREESTVKWAVVDRGPDNGTTAVLGSAASVTLPSGGYHLYTGTFDKTTGNLQLFLDGAAAVNGTSAANTTIASGMQIGNAFEGVAQFKGSHGFVMGTNAAIVAMRGYNVVLDSAEVGVLAGRYPASTGAIDRNIQLDLSGKTLTVYGSTESTATTMGPGEGTMVIPAGNTVKVTNFRTYPYSNTTGGATAATIAGKLEVTAEDTDSIAAEKGVVLGYYLSASSGARTTAATVPSEGEIDAAKAYVMMPWAENVASATLNISGGTVKVKGLMSHQANKGTVNLTDGGVLEVGEILSTGQAIVKKFGYGTFRVKADAEETRAVNFNAETLSQPTTLDPDGHTLTMAADAMTGSGAVKVGGSNGGTVTFSGFTSAFTGTIIIDDSNKDMVSVTSWENFKGTLNYAVTSGSLDLSSYTLDDAAIINITGSGAAVTLKTGPTVNVSSGATVKLKVTEDVYKYEGFLYRGASDGTVQYYQGETPTLVTSEYMNGNNLLPYYSIFQGHADGDNYVGNLNTASDWKNGTDAGFAVPTSRNAAIYVPDGKTLTVTIDNTSSFGEVQIYTDPAATTGGTVIFKKGESGSMTVTSIMCVTANTTVQIDDADPGVVFVSSAEINLESSAKATFNATSYSAPKITGSGTVQVNADKAVTFTDNANVTAANISGTATISSGKTLTASTLNVAGTGVVNVPDSNSSLSVTTATGTGTINWVGKKPDGTVWTANGWSGTNVVSSTGTMAINALNPKDWGNGNSYIKIKNLVGYLESSGGTVSAETIFENGSNDFAYRIENGYQAGTITFDKISGSGTIEDAHNHTTAWHTHIFKDASNFTGSIKATQASGCKRFIFSASADTTNAARTDESGNSLDWGMIIVQTDGSVGLGSGSEWSPGNKIEIRGTVALAGDAKMKKAVTVVEGATFVFEDGASLSFEAASSPVTLPASGTVNIDASAMTLTSSGATILTSTVDFTADDVAKLKSVGRHVFALDGTDAKKINVYPAVAKVGDTYYTDLATAEAAVSESSPFIEVYDGTPAGTYNTFSTGEGVTTYRKTNLNVYYRSGIYWSSTTEGLFELADGTATSAYAGDTIVIDSKSTGDIWADPANPVVATAISVERGVTFKQGEGTGNLFDGKTFTVADDVTLTISGPTRAVTLGAVTFNKATSTGAVTLDGSTNGITLNGNLSGTAPITVARTVVATGRNIANTLKGGGTIVYDGTLPTVAPTFDSSWGGTVWLKNFTSMTNAMMTMDRFCNSSSMVKVTNVAGYIYQHPEITGTLYLEDNGDQKALTINNGWNKDGITVAKLMGPGSLVLGKAATPVSTTGTSSPAFTFTAKDVSAFLGNVEVTNMRFVAGNGFSDTTPLFDTTRNAAAASEVGIVITSGTSATIPAGKTWKAGGLFKWNDGKEWAYCGTVRVGGNLTVNGSLTANAGASGSDNKGKIEIDSGASMTIGSAGLVTAVEEIAVNGTMSAVNKSAWNGAMKLGDTGVLEITRSDSSTNNDEATDYAADVSGSGTLRYSGSGFTVISQKIPTSLTVEANKASGVIVPASGVTIGNLSGSKNIRSDWSTSAETGRNLTIKQSRNTIWSGVFLDAVDRLKSMIVDPGESDTGTLTLAGDQMSFNATATETQDNDLIVNGSVNLTGSWVGPATVTGTFGGVGTVSSVTFNNESIFKVFETSGYGTGTTYLKATGGVTVAAGAVVWVETSQAPYDGMVLMDWTGSDEAPAGTFRFANETYRRGYDINVSGKQLVVSEKTAIVLDVAADTTTEVDEDYYYCNITKTSEGTAKLTGSLEGVNLTISAGTVELAGATIVDSSLFGTGKLMISAGTDLRGLTFDSTFSGTVEIKMGVMVTVTESQKDYILYGHESDYTATQNKDGSWTLEHALPDTVISFASNDPNVAVKVPEDADGVEYVYSHGKIDGVKIGSKPIRLDNFTGMNRVTPFTLSLDVTIPETIDYSGYAEGFGPVLFSFNAGANEIYVMRKSDGVMAARFYPLNNADSTTDYARVSDDGQKAASKVLELGKTYHIELRYWGVLAVKDSVTFWTSRGLCSINTGTAVFVDGVEDWHHTGLRWGTTVPAHINNDDKQDGYTVNGMDFITGEGVTAADAEEAADAEIHKNCIFPTNIVIGAATKATLTGERIFDGLVVHAAGFLNLAGFQNKVGTEAVRAALPGMTSSDAAATYWYDYGVTASGVSGGYALGEQTRYGVAGANNDSTYSRGVIMRHTKSGDGKFTITLGISIPAGSAGGTVCEIPMSSDSITVTYDGSTDMFSLNETAQTTAAGDGAHVLVLTYDTTYGAYLWVDTYDESGDRSNPTISDPSCNGNTLGDVIYFGSGASDSAANNFFANLGVAYQNVQFGVAVCDESDVEQAIEAFDFGVELAKMPLSEKLKYLVNVSHDGGTIPVPTITIGTGASAKVLTGYAALSAAREMGVYQDYTTTLEMSSFNSASKVMTCAVDPSFNGKMSVSLAGSTNRLVWTRLEVATDLSSGSVSLPLSSHAFGNGGDYRWFNIIEEAYTNGVPVETGRIHTKLADRPITDSIFKYGEEGWNHDVYRIPAMAATPDGQTVMGIFDARYCYQDLGVPLDANGNNAGAARYSSPDHYTGIDIAGVFSLDAGENWSYPEVMIDVPNASDPQTGAKTTALTKDMELGDPSIVYDTVNEKFIMMGITGGGLSTVHSGQSDVVTYECSLESVQNGAPEWANRTSVKSLIEAALTTDGGVTIPSYKETLYGNGYLGILQGPGHAFVTRVACGSIPAGTVVWPMQYVTRVSGSFSGGNFAAWKDSGGAWHTTKLVPNDNYVTQEGCITQLDNGYLLYMCKNVMTSATARPFYVSSDGVNWTYLNEISGLASGSMCQGSMLRIGAGTDGHSRYAAVCATGTLRSAIKVYIATDNGFGGVTWGAEPFETVWAGATGTANDGVGAHGNLVYGYNSLVMLNPTTLGVLFEADGHIYFTKVDVAGALQ